MRRGGATTSQTRHARGDGTERGMTVDDGAIRGGGGWQMGGGSMRRGNALSSQTRERQCNNQLDKRLERDGTGGNGAT
jgi:hypothetical protein